MNIIRCKECVHWNAETKGCNRNPSVQPWHENDFCNYGENLIDELQAMREVWYPVGDEQDTAYRAGIREGLMIAIHHIKSSVKGE